MTATTSFVRVRWCCPNPGTRPFFANVFVFVCFGYGACGYLVRVSMIKVDNGRIRLVAPFHRTIPLPCPTATSGLVALPATLESNYLPQLSRESHHNCAHPCTPLFMGVGKGGAKPPYGTCGHFPRPRSWRGVFNGGAPCYSVFGAVAHGDCKQGSYLFSCLR